MNMEQLKLEIENNTPQFIKNFQALLVRQVEEDDEFVNTIAAVQYTGIKESRYGLTDLDSLHKAILNANINDGHKQQLTILSSIYTFFLVNDYITNNHIDNIEQLEFIVNGFNYVLKTDLSKNFRSINDIIEIQNTLQHIVENLRNSTSSLIHAAKHSHCVSRNTFNNALQNDMVLKVILYNNLLQKINCEELQGITNDIQSLSSKYDDHVLTELNERYNTTIARLNAFNEYFNMPEVKNAVIAGLVSFLTLSALFGSGSIALYLLDQDNKLANTALAEIYDVISKDEVVCGIVVGIFVLSGIVSLLTYSFGHSKPEDANVAL